jgi:phenylpyruvate tautomerase PptA (4-oxalocrotonate tautomerase family)
LTNFPVLIDVTDNDLKTKALSSGNDILFMDGVGSANQLDHEIESYTSSTGHLVAWVRIPTLSSTVDTVFYMYYGNPTAANQQNKVGVWDSRFVMVQHLSEATGTHYDSTSHHNDGTPTGGLSQGVAGKIDGADNFDGIDDRIDVPHDNSLNFGTGGFTISVWIKYTDCIDTDVTRKGNMNVSPQMSYKMEVSNNIISGTLEGSNPGGGGTVTDNTARGDNNWHNAVFMRSAGTISLYVDGSLKASQGGAGMDLTSTANVAIGAKPPPISPGNDWFTGMIDEVRYSNVALGADWILTSYNSMGTPSSFVKPFGVEEQKPSSTTGLLRAYSSPAVPTTVIVNNVRRDDWGLNWVKLAPDSYKVHFTDVPGFASPLNQTVAVTAGDTTTVAGVFSQLGYLHVTTSPAVAGTIFVDGVARDDWGLWVPLAPGLHTVHFGDVAGYTAPADQQVTLVAGSNPTVTGNYVVSGGSGPSGFGMLRVTTSPAVVSTIFVGNVAMDDWGLNWVKLAPGTYTVHFSDVPGYISPANQTVVVNVDATTVVTGVFTQVGYLHVTTNPAVAGTISVNGVPMDDWGVWVSLPAGSYTVSFGDVAGYTKPADQVVNVIAGSTTPVTGNYV